MEKKGSIGTVMIGTILGMLGIHTTDEMLNEIISEVDADGKYFQIFQLFLCEKTYLDHIFDFKKLYLIRFFDKHLYKSFGPLFTIR